MIEVEIDYKNPQELITLIKNELDTISGLESVFYHDKSAYGRLVSALQILDQLSHDLIILKFEMHHFLCEEMEKCKEFNK